MRISELHFPKNIKKYISFLVDKRCRRFSYPLYVISPWLYSILKKKDMFGPGISRWKAPIFSVNWGEILIGNTETKSSI